MTHKLLLSLAFLFPLTACNPFFVLRGAYEEAHILLGRVNIEEVIKDPESSPEEKEKLQAVITARAFAEHEIGLTTKDSYTTYTKLDRDSLAWVVVASRIDSFTLHTWWYPIVGTVPYKGYFEREDAECSAKRLKNRGFETWVRDTDAMSTLGWFNDPVLSSTLKSNVVQISNTVIHELFHQTVWIPGHVPFNETCAHFVGTQGALELFKKELTLCRDTSCKERGLKRVEYATKRLEFELEFSDVIMELYSELETLYADANFSEAAKIIKRGVIFDEVLKNFKERYPTLKALKEINNAEIIQLKIYLTQLRLFDELYRECAQRWGCFLEHIKKIAQKGGKKSPYELLEELLPKRKTASSITS